MQTLSKRDKVKETIAQFPDKTPGEIAELCNCSISYAYGIMNGNGNKERAWKDHERMKKLCSKPVRRVLDDLESVYYTLVNDDNAPNMRKVIDKWIAGA